MTASPSYDSIRTLVERAKSVDPLGMMRRVQRQRKELKRLNRQNNYLLTATSKCHHFPDGTIQELPTGNYKATRANGLGRVTLTMAGAVEFLNGG